MNEVEEALKLRMQRIISETLTITKFITDGLPLPNLLTAAEEFVEALRDGSWQLERLGEVSTENLIAELERRGHGRT